MCDKPADKCAGANGPVKTASGFFSMFGGDSDLPIPSSSCAGCGSISCNCNCKLTQHLKENAGLGVLPPLIDKCEDIPGPGFRDRCPKSTCADKQECFACGKPPPAPACEAPKTDKCPEVVEDKCDKKPKCPPMPITDCSDCKPAWISCSPSISASYPAPDGVEILPISVGGRGNKGSSCGKCGQDKGPPGKPKVSANCPMMRPKCPGLKDEGVGFFAKLTALFNKGNQREKSPLERVFQSLKVEDEQIRHHRDVFNPELVVRKDGYLAPYLGNEYQ